MDGRQLTILALEAKTRLKNGRPIEEEMLRDLFAAIAEFIVEDKEVPQEFEGLMRDAEAQYAYGDFADSPVFCAGACWGATSIFASKKAKEVEAVNRIVQKDVARRHQELLETISENPGITQQCLAEKLGKPKSNLAQILAWLECQRLFMMSPFGRYKKYYITDKGSSILREIKDEEASASDTDGERDEPRVPHGLVKMKLAALYAYNDSMDAVIDVRDWNKEIKVPPQHGRGRRDVAMPTPTIFLRNTTALTFPDTKNAFFRKSACISNELIKSKTIY